MEPSPSASREAEAELLENLKQAREEFLAAGSSASEAAEAARARYLQALRAFTTLLRGTGKAA